MIPSAPSAPRGACQPQKLSAPSRQLSALSSQPSAKAAVRKRGGLRSLAKPSAGSFSIANHAITHGGVHAPLPAAGAKSQGLSRPRLAQHPGQRQPAARLAHLCRFARLLIAQARALYQHDPFALELDQTIYVFDSTTIDLCLSLFPWAQFRRRKSAVKLHTLLDLRGNIPTAVYVTGGQVHDVNLLDRLALEAAAFYLLDRGYIDYRRLYQFTQALAFFVTRAQLDTRYRRCGWRRVDRATGVRSTFQIQNSRAGKAELRTGISSFTLHTLSFTFHPSIRTITMAGCTRRYSYLSATIGSTLAARRAGM